MRAALVLRALWRQQAASGHSLRAYSSALPAELAAAGPAGLTAAAAASGSPTERYAALVACGTLRHDPQQAACVERLDRLSRELQQHAEAVAAYQRQYGEYQQRRRALLAELLPGEEARLAAEEEAAAAAAASPSHLSSMRSWLSAALGAAAPEAAPQAAAPTRRTRQQRRALAMARVERQVDAHLGPPPPPPPTPKGVYLHGSVGSGKSLLMDLLSASVRSGGAVPHHRRLHFNAAMLELHSRMHAIESQRMRSERQQMEEYAAAVREQQQLQLQWGGQQAAGAGERDSGEHDSSSSTSSTSASWQQVLRLDPIAQKLRRSKLARLAFRRMMRDKERRSSQQHSEALAAANAAILRHAARALIRNCDTLQLMTSSSSSFGSSGGSSSGGDAEGELEGGAAGGSGSVAAGGDSARIAALLCFDEVQVSDVFSAVALKGLMEALAAEGCVVVATSNRAPGELDRHGLHEDLFNHFTSHLHSACDILSLNSGEDYRRLLAAQTPLAPLPDTLAQAQPPAQDVQQSEQQQHQQQQVALQSLEGVVSPQASYFYPLGPSAATALQLQWRRVAAASVGGGANGAAASSAAQQEEQGPLELQVMFGRKLAVECCTGGTGGAGGAAWFRFEELCARPLGAADYLAVAQAFHTVFLEGVPALSMQVRDQARRFITLVDELYNHRCRLVCSAATAPDQLFAGANHEEPIIDLESLQFETAVEGSRLRRNLMEDGGVAPVAASAAEVAAAAQRLGGAEERFAFARAVSRLYEMQSELYLASRPRE